MIVYQLVSSLFWLLLIPFCIGLLPVRLIEEKKRNGGFILLAGYFVQFSLFWLVTVPAVIFVKYDSFLVVVWGFTILSLLVAAAGIIVSLYKKKAGEVICLIPGRRRETRLSVSELAAWLIFAGLLFFQLYKAFVTTSFDGDDAYYVAQSLVAEQSNTMYLILPYTGGTTSIDLRHALAVLPMWIAYIGRMTNIHTTIIAHTLLPLVLIPLTYLLYYEMGKRLFLQKKNIAPFLVLMSILQIFGNISIYTNETFFLTRTWQGKSLTASLIIPALLWLLLWIFGRKDEENKSENGLWILLAFVNLTAGICSSMAVFLGGMLVAIVAFWMAVTEKKFKILVKAGLALLPNVIYMLLYLLLR